MAVSPGGDQKSIDVSIDDTGTGSFAGQYTKSFADDTEFRLIADMSICGFLDELGIAYLPPM